MRLLTPLSTPYSHALFPFSWLQARLMESPYSPTAGRPASPQVPLAALTTGYSPGYGPTITPQGHRRSGTVARAPSPEEPLSLSDGETLQQHAPSPCLALRTCVHPV